MDKTLTPQQQKAAIRRLAEHPGEECGRSGHFGYDGLGQAGPGAKLERIL